VSTPALSPTVQATLPSPTDPATPSRAVTATPGNAFFQLDLAEAKATVLAETLLEQEPFIQRSGYFSAADGLEVLTSPEHANRYWLLEADRLIEGELEAAGGPLMAIELTQRGMDILGIYDRASGGSDATWEPGPCLPAPASVRYGVTVIVDPRGGRFLGHFVGQLPEELWERTTGDWPHRRVSPTPWPSDTPTASGTLPTPWPTRTPFPSPGPILDPALPAVALGVGEYPVGVGDMVQVAPLVLGSRWTYRLKGHESALRWHSYLVEESITKAYRRSADLMEVEVGATQGSGIWGSGVLSTWRVITADAVIAGNTFTYARDVKPLSREALLSALAAEQTPRDGPLAMVRLPIVAGDRYNYWWDVTRQETLDTPAGTFGGCSVHTEIFNAGNSWGHWLCPGVGSPGTSCRAAAASTAAIRCWS
jgi:hypothetical protein